MWRTCFNSRIGGGVATFAMLFAKAIGAKVSVTSRVENKESLPKHMAQTFLLIVLEMGREFMRRKSRFNN